MGGSCKCGVFGSCRGGLVMQGWDGSCRDVLCRGGMSGLCRVGGSCMSRIPLISIHEFSKPYKLLFLEFEPFIKCKI